MAINRTQKAKVGIKKVAKPVATKEETVVEEVVEDVVEETVAEPAPKKKAPATKKPVAKKETKKAAEPKKETKLNIQVGNTPKEKKKIEIGELGILKREDLVAVYKERLEAAGAKVGSLKDVQAMIKILEEVIIEEGFKKHNTMNIFGTNISRSKIKARTYTNNLLEDPRAYATLELPHYKMTLAYKDSQRLVGSINEDGNFVAEDGTVYDDAAIDALNKEFFEAE